jgi:glycosyltransferase involved in cell wall biosynthesis
VRIAFDVSYVQKRRAGIGRHALQLITALLNEDKRNEYVLHGWSWRLDPETLRTLQKTNVRLSTAKIPGAVKRWYWNTLRMPAIEQLIGPFDIFHSTDPFVPPTRRSKRLCTVHDIAYKKFPELFEQRVLSWGKHVERSIAAADAVIVPSLQTKADVAEAFRIASDAIHVVQLPPDASFRFGKDEAADMAVVKKFNLAKPYILFVGTLEPRKNIPTLIHAFERLHNHDVELVIVGKKGWLYDGILETMNRSHYRSRIHYLEYVADSELSSLYRCALCFVYPSLYEGYGFPVLEAMASGVPIITSMNSAMRELADGVALLIEPTSVDDIAEAMEMLIANPIRRLEMRQRGLHIVEQLSSASVARTLLNIYQSLVA